MQDSRKGNYTVKQHDIKSTRIGAPTRARTAPDRPYNIAALVAMSAFRSPTFIARLRAAAPNLSRDLLAGPPCAQRYSQKHSLLRQWIKKSSKGAVYQNTSFRTAFKGAKRSLSTVALPGPTSTATISAHSTTKARFFPETSSNAVAYWLLASAGSVFGIVVFGGLTRLTESG